MLINFYTNIAAFQKSLSAIASKQLPFATAQALTALARLAADAERANEPKKLDRPRPFTMNAIGVIPARRETQSATLFMKDLTAWYLEPYEFGGLNKLNKTALLKPVDAKPDLDQYGNLPRGFTKRLKGRKDIFIGAVHTKSGVIRGIWQRPYQTHINGKRQRKSKYTNMTGHLKLLVRFADAHPVKQRLDWFAVADHTVRGQFNGVFGRALARAIATAKP